MVAVDTANVEGPRSANCGATNSPTRGPQERRPCENDNAWALSDRNGAEGKVEIPRIARQLGFDSLVVGDGVTVRLVGCAVNDVNNHFGALNVGRELEAEPFAL